jgi:hypothetical protein
MGRPTIAELQDELKQRNRRIAELRHELDEARDLIQRQDEQLQDVEQLIESWKEAFAMTQGDDGLWTASEFVKTAEDYRDRYVDLVRQWNKFVPAYNAAVLKRDVGRPLGASDAQVATVRKLHKQGMSLRGICDETSLGFQTVRTIVDKGAGTDRATRKQLQRIDPERGRERIWLAKQQLRKALPKRIAAAEKANTELRQEAKGLK